MKESDRRIANVELRPAVFATWISRRTLFLVLIVFIITGCTFAPEVTLTKKPLTVVKVFLEDVSDKRIIPLKSFEEAATTWTFGCSTNFNFDIVQNTKLGKDDFMVTIKITKVDLALTAPIRIWISKKASRSVLSHEMAHVRICKHFYEGINQDAISAGRFVIGKEYQASGVSVDDAVRKSISRASKDIYERYNSAATDAINHVSTRFDELEGRDNENAGKSDSYKVVENSDAEIEAHFQEAFGKYQTQLGEIVK